MKSSSVIIGLVIAGVALLIFAGARVSRHPDEVAVAAADLNLQHVEGSPAPDFQLTSLEGKKVKLSDYRGQAVLVNFWATYCEPCKIEMPWLVELRDKYHAQGFEILGVAMDDAGHDAIAKFASDLKVSYPILQGTEAVGDAYGGVQGLPETFVIGRNGKIVKSFLGIHSQSDFEDAIKQALATPAAATAVAQKDGPGK